MQQGCSSLQGHQGNLPDVIDGSVSNSNLSRSLVARLEDWAAMHLDKARVKVQRLLGERA
jgi:hypothetical protein